MRKRAWVITAAIAGAWSCASVAQAANAEPFELLPPGSLMSSGQSSQLDGGADAAGDRPLFLAAVDQPPDVYPEIIPVGEQGGGNSGGVSFGLDVSWMNKYIFRGIDQSTIAHKTENALQFDTNAHFDTGNFPHPFIGLFVNVFNNDPVSRFEEVRPYFGVDWNIKPITVSSGFNAYIFPNTKNLAPTVNVAPYHTDTQEVFLSIKLDDSRIYNSPTPIFSPYVYAAYDFRLYHGFYLEAGVRHDFFFEDFGTTISPLARVAYVIDDPYFSLTSNSRKYGLQHYDVGLLGNFSLNHAINLGHHYGEWSVQGFLYYTGRIDAELKADTQIWGGVGLEFRY